MAPFHSRNTCPYVSHIQQKDITQNRDAKFLELEEISSRARRLVRCSERSVHKISEIPSNASPDILDSSSAFGS